MSALVGVLAQIDPGGPRRSLVGSGHYASVLAIDGSTGVAICTDGVGTKLIVAEQARRFDTIGVDCVAMNVNDLVCVGARPLAMVDYLAVEQADPAILRDVALGLKNGAERAGVEIPGGELAQLPEMIRGHPSPLGIDLVGTAIGVVPLDQVITGASIRPGDAVLGLPSSGIHSNGFTLARQVLLVQAGLSLEDEPPGLGRPLADELLEPTEIYVRAVMELLDSGADVRGLAHITGDGLLNLRRLSDDVGWEISEPLPPQPIFRLIQTLGGVPDEQMQEVFNMGTGFCCVVPESDERSALDLLRRHYRGAARIGQVTTEAGVVRLPG